MYFPLPTLQEIFSQSVTLQFSGILFIALIGIFLLVVIRMLHVTYVQYEKTKTIEESKSDIITLVSHQLRTPLSAINWYIESLLSGDVGALTDDQREYVEKVRESNHRMVFMVDSLLHISEIEMDLFAFLIKPTNIVEILEGTLKELQFPLQGKNIKLIKNIQGDLTSIPTDSRYVKIILGNLLLNAIQYSKNDAEISVSLAQEEHNLKIAVTDHGSGIPVEDQKRIFSKLFRAHNALKYNTDGMGLGLYLISSIIHRSGGTITFTSQEGKGSTFHVSLPLNHSWK